MDGQKVLVGRTTCVSQLLRNEDKGFSWFDTPHQFHYDSNVLCSAKISSTLVAKVKVISWC